MSGARTHCPRGHAYEGANLYLNPRPDGGFTRVCRTCKREKQNAKRATASRGRSPRAPRELTALRTHCPRGHAYDEENTYLSTQGKRQCRKCRRWRQSAEGDAAAHDRRLARQRAWRAERSISEGR